MAEPELPVKKRPILKTGAAVVAEKEKENRKRTKRQNRLLWGRIGDIAKQVKWPVDGELVYLNKKDWRWIFTAALKRESRVAQGIDGGVVLLGHHTSDMTVKDMMDLLELINAFGAVRGVKWTQDDVTLGREWLQES